MRLPFLMISASLPNWFTGRNTDDTLSPPRWLTAIFLLFLLVPILLSQTAQGAEATQGMKITGDQESPQVLYIIPWKEQPVTPPEQPRFQEQILEPLTPCDLDQQTAKFLPELWNCIPVAINKLP